MTVQVLKRLPTKERIHQLQKLSCTIFGEEFNPTGKRSFDHLLKRELVGPQVVKYYGDNDSVPTFKDFKKWFPELKLVDPREEYRLQMAAARRARNKGAPKKKSS
ncbi:RSM27 [[Candida] subhashii]|uniref:Small ribosomal subunit protein mS33 n=1 Tax=[Candida] subhashii TaxID=561895 RepID=A0A8J5QK18_9ASCO|nr:RSM27 [[Candida] subhashii]KAG7662441.1 RSM27 [[Candida] subhashii]